MSINRISGEPFNLYLESPLRKIEKIEYNMTGKAAIVTYVDGVFEGFRYQSNKGWYKSSLIQDAAFDSIRFKDRKITKIEIERIYGSHVNHPVKLNVECDKVIIANTIVDDGEILTINILEQTDERVVIQQGRLYNEGYINIYVVTIAPDGTKLLLTRKFVDQDQEWWGKDLTKYDVVKNPLNQHIWHFGLIEPKYTSEHLWISADDVIYTCVAGNWLPIHADFCNKKQLKRIMPEHIYNEYLFYLNMK